METKYKLRDKHRNFAVAVGAGEFVWKAYKAHVATSKKTSKPTCEQNGAKLAKNPEIKAIIDKTRQERDKAVIKANVDNLPPELRTTLLTKDELDSFHYAVIRGEVECEEIIPVVTITKDSKTGREIERTTSFHRVKRKPNIRERQISVDAIYKRFGHYAPVKGMFGVKNMGDGDEEANVDRVLILSNGEKLILTND